MLFLMAKDFFHDLVKTALINDGWTITHDPYELQGNDPDWQIDLGAEIVIAAEENERKIAVEVKSYLETFRSGIARSIKVYELCLLIYDPVSKTVVRWEPHPIN